MPDILYLTPPHFVFWKNMQDISLFVVVGVVVFFINMQDTSC